MVGRIRSHPGGAPQRFGHVLGECSVSGVTGFVGVTTSVSSFLLSKHLVVTGTVEVVGVLRVLNGFLTLCRVFFA